MKSNISKHFWLQNNGNNFHHTVLVNFIVSVLDETQTNSSHPAWESKQPTSRSESDPTRLKDPTAATLHIYWTSHWKNHNLILRLKFKWLFKQNVYSGSALFHTFLRRFVHSLKRQKWSTNTIIQQLLQAKVDTDTDKISDWCQQSLRNIRETWSKFLNFKFLLMKQFKTDTTAIPPCSQAFNKHKYWYLCQENLLPKAQNEVFNSLVLSNQQSKDFQITVIKSD